MTFLFPAITCRGSSPFARTYRAKCRLTQKLMIPGNPLSEFWTSNFQGISTLAKLTFFDWEARNGGLAVLLVNPVLSQTIRQEAPPRRRDAIPWEHPRHPGVFKASFPP